MKPSSSGIGFRLFSRIFAARTASQAPSSAAVCLTLHTTNDAWQRNAFIIAYDQTLSTRNTNPIDLSPRSCSSLTPLFPHRLPPPRPPFLHTTSGPHTSCKVFYNFFCYSATQTALCFTTGPLRHSHAPCLPSRLVAGVFQLHSSAPRPW